MRNKQFEGTTPLIEPLYDTWGGKKYAGSWCIAPSFDFTSLSTQEVNAWFATSVSKTLDAFSHLVRAWRVDFNTIYRDDVSGIRIEWRLGDSYDLYVENVRRAIQEYLAPIYLIEICVDLFAYVRTKDSPDIPIRAWVRLPSDFRIWGGPENTEPYLCFNVAHTLFRSRSKDAQDNGELHALNQPLLEKALRQWEEYFDSVIEVDGLSGIYQYGFLAEV